MPVVGSQRVRCLAGASRGCMSADRTRDTCEGYYTIGQAKLIVLVEAPWLSYYYAALPGKRKQESGWRANAYPSFISPSSGDRPSSLFPKSHQTLTSDERPH